MVNKLAANKFKTDFENNSFFDPIRKEHRVEGIILLDKLCLDDFSGDNQKIFFLDCSFEDELYCNLRNLESIQFMNCNFNGGTKLSTRVKSNIFITRCIFLKKLDFVNNYAGNIMISDSIFFDDVFAQWNTVTESSLYNSSITLDANLFHKKLYLSQNTIKGSIVVRSKHSYFNELIINDSNDYNFGMDGLIEVEHLIITGFLEDKNKLIISNVRTNKIFFSNFINNGKVLFINVFANDKESPSIKFIDSDIGNTTFLKCNFQEFDLFYSSSSISNVKIIGGIFPGPENIQKITGDDNDSFIIPVLIQLKKIYESSGDSINASKFHEFELNLYKNASSNLKSEINILNQLKKMYEQRGDSVKVLEYQAKELEIYMNSPEISYFEKFNLMSAFYSNNFGTDWIKALKFLILGSIPFYIIFIFCQGYRPGDDFKLFLEIVANYLEFLNPLRKSDFFIINGQPENLESLTRIWDFFGRIFNAFAVYQLIQAFRKYGKK